jgi:glycyl-tRNA synthetase beta chain
MSYQRQFGRAAGETVHFVRPAHAWWRCWADVVPVNTLGLDAGRTTLGHRFLSSGALQIAAPTPTETLAAQGKVIASFAERREKIRTALLAKAGADQVLMPEALLDEVTALVEWPVVYECKFEDEFLAVPQECLILTMQTNQKYFALTDANGKLRSRFLIVSNMETARRNTSSAATSAWCARACPMPSSSSSRTRRRPWPRVPLLANVVYHNKLGTQLQRTERVQAWPARSPPAGGDVALAERGALLAKADLLTDMVGEFPELQGIMGTYYARHDGEPTTSRWPPPSTTSRALPATRCPPPPPAPPWPWPTSWKPWSASGASACSRPATRTRSRCAATRWACCAC